MISETITQLSTTLDTTEQKLALNDLMHELHSRQLLARDVIEAIWTARATSSPVRASSATERARSPHTVLTAADSLGSEGQDFLATEDVDRVIPRDPRNPNNRRRHLLSGYGEALELIDQLAPEAVQPIRSYVIALRDECARARVRVRSLSARLADRGTGRG